MRTRSGPVGYAGGDAGAQETAEQVDRRRDGDDVPVHVAEEPEHDEGDRGGDRRQRGLQRVGQLQPVQRDAEDADQDHAHRAAEVAAVRGGEEEGDVHPVGVAVDAVLAVGQPPREERLDREQQAGKQYEHRDDEVEGRRRRGEQQDAAGRPAGERHHTEADEPPPLAGVLAAEAGDAAEIPGPLGDGVGHVGRDRRQTEGHQGREEDQRTAAGDRVDHPGDEGDAGEMTRSAAGTSGEPTVARGG